MVRYNLTDERAEWISKSDEPEAKNIRDIYALYKKGADLHCLALLDVAMERFFERWIEFQK